MYQSPTNLILHLGNVRELDPRPIVGRALWSAWRMGIKYGMLTPINETMLNEFGFARA